MPARRRRRRTRRARRFRTRPHRAAAGGPPAAAGTATRHTREPFRSPTPKAPAARQERTRSAHAVWSPETTSLSCNQALGKSHRSSSSMTILSPRGRRGHAAGRALAIGRVHDFYSRVVYSSLAGGAVASCLVAPQVLSVDFQECSEVGQQHPCLWCAWCFLPRTQKQICGLKKRKYQGRRYYLCRRTGIGAVLRRCSGAASLPASPFQFLLLVGRGR